MRGRPPRHFQSRRSGPAQLTPPDLSLWPDLSIGDQAKAARRVNLDALTRADVATWRAGEALLLSGRMLTGRDAAHQRLVSMIEAGEPLPVDLRDRAIYYVGPVGAAPGEVVGPAGPTTSTRMDGFTDAVLSATGLLVMIGKAERGPAAIDAIRRTAPLISSPSVVRPISSRRRSSPPAFSPSPISGWRRFTNSWWKTCRSQSQWTQAAN